MGRAGASLRARARTRHSKISSMVWRARAQPSAWQRGTTSTPVISTRRLSTSSEWCALAAVLVSVHPHPQRSPESRSTERIRRAPCHSRSLRTMRQERETDGTSTSRPPPSPMPAATPFRRRQALSRVSHQSHFPRATAPRPRIQSPRIPSLFPQEQRRPRQQPSTARTPIPVKDQQM